MNFARVAAFDDQPGARAQPPADHFVVQARARQERRDRRHLGRHAAVGEDDQVRPLLDRRTGLFEERLECGLKTAGPVGCPEEHGQRERLEAAPVVELLDPRQLVVVEDRHLKRDLPAGIRAAARASSPRRRPP